MKYILVRTGILDSQMISQGGGDENLHCAELFHVHDVSCLEISDLLYTTLRTGWDTRVIELDYNTAYWGSVFFSEIRTVGKIMEPSKGPWTPSVKVPVEITPELTGYIVSFMKTVAIEILNQEFDRRYTTYLGTSLVEKESWEIQKHEAREWLTYGDSEEHRTPFLDYLAEEQGVDKTALATKILEKAENYADRLSDMLVVYQRLIKEVKSKTTVWDLNIFFEDYLGVMMPDTQAVQIPGRTVSETDATRVKEVKTYEFRF